MSEKNEKTKTLKWNLNDPLEREVWEWLRSLPHGSFSEETKAYWMSRYERRNNSDSNNNPGNDKT